MAERRMFAKTIIDSDSFLDMSLSTQALYFHLAMRADDDGFINNPKKIMRMIGSSDDEMKILIAKRYIIPFDSGIVVIRHWRIHNYIQKDRYHPSACEEKALLVSAKDKAYEAMDTSCIHGCIQGSIQGSIQDGNIGKVRLGKVRLGKREEAVDEPPPHHPSEPAAINQCPYEKIKQVFNSTCLRLPRVLTFSAKRRQAVNARWKELGCSMEEVQKLFDKVAASDFLNGVNDRNWTACFDWVMKPGNMVKILEGNYDSKGASKPKEDIALRARSDGFKPTRVL